MAAVGTEQRFRVLQRLGSGGMASVHLAEDTLLGRRVALKRLHGPGGDQAARRLRREARVGASLSHPRIVSVFDVLIEEDGLVVVMEYVEGTTLRETLRAGRLPPARVVDVVRALADGLDHLHRRGVVHRDVKPANVLLGANGDVKLADLGIAVAADRTRITTSGAVLGTIGYMAPEQLEGRPAKPAVDVYGLAAVAFEALSGRRPRPEENPLALARAMEKGPAPDLRAAWPEAPRAAAELLASAMAYDPAARPVTAGELAERLSTALEAPRTEPVAPPATRTLPGAPPRRRPRGPGPQGTQARRPRPPAPAAPHPQGTQARRALPPAPAPRRPERRRPRWRLATFLAALAALVFVGLVVSGALWPSGERPATTKRPRPARAAPTGGSGAGGGGGPSSAAPTTAAGTVGSTDPSTPAGAVQAFYQRQAAHDFQGAWSLADDSFRAQLQGLDSFASQSRGMRSIAFHRADVVSRSGDAATVAIATTAVHSTHTDHCRGTVDLVRGSTSWLLHQIHIAC